MLKISVDNNKNCEIETSGEGTEIVADLFFAIGNIYGLLRQNSEVLADGFKKFCQFAVLDESPVWRDAPVPGGAGAVIVRPIETTNEEDIS